MASAGLGELNGAPPQRSIGGADEAHAGLGESDPCLPDQDEGKRPRTPAQGWGSRRLRQRSVKRDLRRANAGSGERSASSTSSRQRRSTTGRMQLIFVPKDAPSTCQPQVMRALP